MTPDQKISVHEKLRAFGRTNARAIATALGYPPEVVYEALVHLESRNLCRIEITHEKSLHGRDRVCEWVAA